MWVNRFVVRPCHRSRSIEQGLPAREDQQGQQTTADPPCRKQQCHTRRLKELPADTLENWREELGVHTSFSRPRVSNDTPFSESMFRTVKYRPEYPNRPFGIKAETCEWVAAFVDWYNLPAPAQRNQIGDTPTAPQWPCRGDLFFTGCRLQTGTPAATTPLITIHTLLASVGAGLDQTTNAGNRTKSRYVSDGSLISPMIAIHLTLDLHRLFHSIPLRAKAAD